MAYAPEDVARIKADICERIANGESLRAICEAQGMPNKSTALLWLSEDADFSTQYARARDQQADHYAEQIIEIADTEEDPNRARVRIDARKWTASKLAPKRYGDKLDIENKITADDTIAGLLTRIATNGTRLIAPVDEEGSET